MTAIATIDRNKFNKYYDDLMPLICEPYDDFLYCGASAIPHSVRSVCDIGAGTGNFSQQVRKIHPTMRLAAYDQNAAQLERAQVKVPGLEIHVGNAVNLNLNISSWDFLISSLTLHHFTEEELASILARVAHSGKGIVNFDMVMTQGKSRDDAIAKVREYASSYFEPKALDTIAEEMIENDKFLPLDFHIDVCKREGLDFTLVAKSFPYVVYKAESPNRKR